eukprot:4030510-Lingulodinium_polyedra.AAC.1
MARTASTWSGIKLRRSMAAARTPTCTPSLGLASVANAIIAGNAPARGKTTTASRQWSGPQTVGAIGSRPFATSRSRAWVAGASMHLIA